MNAPATSLHAKTPSVIRVAPESEQGVELLRERLSLWLGVTAVLATSYDLSANVAGVWALGRSWGAQLAHPGNWAVAIEAAFIVALWFTVRLARPSLRALQAVDVALIAMLSLVGAYISYLCPAAVHPGLDLGAPPSANLPIGVVSNIAMLTLRAALLPSTPQRTFLVGVVSTVPILGAAYLVHYDYGSAEATNFALGTTLVSLVVIPIPVLISRVIYNLQQQVRAAEELGQYTLEGKIGEGGMGIVYRASHVFLRRPTAIKLLPARRAGATSLARFEREVLQTSRLTHPNTVAIYDYGRTADGSFYYAMEYLEGLSLEQLAQHDGPQAPGRVIHLLRQACGALSEAHRRNLIHRDIKPANLYLCVRGDISDFIKVLDFGLAKELETTDPTLSTAGALLGTPLYMAPEAITGPAVDTRADLYALGAVAYFLLTGTPPFPADSAVAVFVNTLQRQPESPSDRLGSAVPAQLEAVVLRCLAKDPAERFPSAAALSAALAACTDIPPWTGADADTWWSERAPALLTLIRRERRTDGSSTGERTVAVDLEQRGRN